MSTCPKCGGTKDTTNFDTQEFLGKYGKTKVVTVPIQICSGCGHRYFTPEQAEYQRRMIEEALSK
ncbi:MAG: YgiT-type zinc finger protein [Deltaproteobacteria bacterium]|nr:YgiT-type zinc finger protein [Deltaproteobacteria bacterium]